MAQPTTAALMERLSARGFVEAAGAAKDGRRGPNAQLYQVKRDSAHIAAARINASELAVAVADITGEIVAQRRKPVADPSHPVEELTAALRGVCADAALDTADVSTVVVGTPGSVDPATGDVGYVTGHPEWRHGIRERLEEAVGVTVRLENQLNLAGISEYEYGQGRDRSALVLISVGPGTGMAVILDGRIWSGTSGGAGEIAYLPTPGASEPRVDPDTQRVTGGYGELVEPCIDTDPVRESPPHPSLDDERAQEIAHRIAIGAAAAVAIIDPGMVVLTGTTVRSGGPALVDMVRHEITTMSPWPTEVRASSVDGDAVIRGAIATALRVAHNSLWGSVTGWTIATS